MTISNNILKNVKDLINDLNEQIQKENIDENIDIDELQEKIRVIDMLIHSITRIKKFEQIC